MLGWARKHLTYANVAATLALLIALSGGTAYAATKIKGNQIAKNAITAKHIQTNAVRAKELRTGAVTSVKVKDGSLQAADLAPGVLPAAAYSTHAQSGGRSLVLSGSYQVAATTEAAKATWSGAYFGPIRLPAVATSAVFPYLAQLQVSHTGAGTGTCRLAPYTSTSSYSTGEFTISGAGTTRSGVADYFYQPDNAEPKSVRVDVECRLDTGALTVTGAAVTVVAVRR